MINKPLRLIFCKCKLPTIRDAFFRKIKKYYLPLIGDYYYCGKCHCPIRPAKMNYETHRLK